MKAVPLVLRHAARYMLLAAFCATVVVPKSAGLMVDDPTALAKSDAEQGHFQDAENILTAYLALHPDDVKARLLLAYILFRDNKAADSLRAYTEAAKLRVPTARDLRIVALDYVLLNEFEDAAHWIRLAASFDPTDADVIYDMGRIEYKLNRFDAARAAFMRALELDPSSVKAEDNLGLTLEGLNLIEEALDAYRKAVAMQAGISHPSEQPLLDLGSALVERGQLDEALPLLQEALRIKPHNSAILTQLGKLYSQKGNLQAARESFEEALHTDPNNASLHFQLGQVYKRAGANEKAQSEFALAKALFGTSSHSP